MSIVICSVVWSIYKFYKPITIRSPNFFRVRVSTNAISIIIIIKKISTTTPHSGAHTNKNVYMNTTDY